MERFFQRPLDEVRVHSGPESRRAADSYGAYALTYGQDIHLGSRGESLPGGQMKGLLAHETAHTIQQGHAQPVTQLSAVAPEGEGSPAEQQASGLSSAFMAHEAGDSAGLAIRDSIGLRPASTSRVQLAMHPVHFGSFEDHVYNSVKDSTGTEVGVQIHLKFHPGNNVDAKKIGLTQAAEGKDSGAQINQGFYGRRQATAGAGAGYFIDRVQGRPSPLYGTVGTVTAGADASKLGSYAAPGVQTLNAAQIAATGLTGVTVGGGSKFGFRFTDAGKLHGPEPAELADVPQLPVTNSSEQVFETAALAFEGSMAGTYLGSVQWGWRRDATGTFTTVPLTVISQGVPSANFLTAANIWNTAKEFYGLVANASPTNVLKADLTVDFTVPQGTPLTRTATGSHGGQTYYRVNIADGTGRTGFVLDTDTGMGDFGRETVDLPVPEIYTLNTASVLDGEERCSPSDPTLPAGTRVRYVGPFGNLPEYMRVEVADGPMIGHRGVLRRSLTTREALGTQ
jgi:hypothetical protein